jgi:hypothetical protein
MSIPKGDCLSSQRKSKIRGEPADDAHPINDSDINPPASRMVKARLNWGMVPLACGSRVSDIRPMTTAIDAAPTLGDAMERS